MSTTTITIDGPLTLEQIHQVCVKKYRVQLSDTVKSKINENRAVVDKIINSSEIVYGMNTGFGSLVGVQISKEDLQKLQLNLIISHDAGTGPAASEEIVRGMMLARIMCFARAVSGVRLEIVQGLVDLLNAHFYPHVPILGTVGASGDLAPLSALINTCLGNNDTFVYHNGVKMQATEYFKQGNVKPLPTLEAKEGLALNNGTQFITSNLALAVYQIDKLFAVALKVFALTVDMLHGTDKAFDPRIHDLKGHKGQIFVAEKLKEYLAGSDIQKNYGSKIIQDAYSLRCLPQILGKVKELIDDAKTTVVNEFNSANDNPLIFDYGDIKSGGNFHGNYVSITADILSIALTHLINVSERHIARYTNKNHTKFMPDFLVSDAGLNSGFMITQYVAAGLAAESRQLASPASVHNIETCNGTEDLVSMGGWSTRKLTQIVDLAWKTIAAELLVALRAKEFTNESTSAVLEEFVAPFRGLVPSEKDGDFNIRPVYEKLMHRLH